jgi:argininosuccinate lyase
MSTKLWDKGYEINKEIEQFEVGDDVIYDKNLLIPDLLGSIAHAAGLHKIGMVTDQQFKELQGALIQLIEKAESGEFTVEQGDEDVHTTIEAALTEMLGDTGKRIHTARSRNDQVIVDTRIYLKQVAPRLLSAILDCAQSLHDFAEKYRTTPMPGYTHMQRAMLSSVGVWAGAYLEALMDDLVLLETALDINNQCPLGSAASYGVPLPIDRQYVSDLLGFDKVQNNVLYAQHGRGKFEAMVVQALAQVLLDLSKMAQDIMLFTTAEYNFFLISPEFTTGSSIMPQKKNLGAMEMLRAKGSIMVSYQGQMMSVLTGLPSGYNMDYQETKKPFMDAIELTIQSCAVASLTIQQIIPNEDAMNAACTPDLFATDAAYELVEQGVPFRDAYRQIGTNLDDVAAMDPHEQLKKRTHQGTAGDLRLKVSQERINAVKQSAESRQKSFTDMVERLMNTELISS